MSKIVVAQVDWDLLDRQRNGEEDDSIEAIVFIEISEAEREFLLQTPTT